MTIAEMMLQEKPKVLLNPQIPINVGDVVTTNDDFAIIEDGNVYVVKSIDGNLVTLCYIEYDDSENGYSVNEIIMQRDELLYLGVEFIDVNSQLYNLCMEIRKGI